MAILIRAMRSSSKQFSGQCNTLVVNFDHRVFKKLSTEMGSLNSALDIFKVKYFFHSLLLLTF